MTTNDKRKTQFETEEKQKRAKEVEYERVIIDGLHNNQKLEFAKRNCNYSIRTNPDYKPVDYDEKHGRTTQRSYYHNQYSSVHVSTDKPILTCEAKDSRGNVCGKEFDTDPKRCYGGFVFYRNVNDLIVWKGGINKYYCYNCY